MVEHIADPSLLRLGKPVENVGISSSFRLRRESQTHPLGESASAPNSPLVAAAGLNIMHVGPPAGEHDMVRWCMQDQIRILANHGLLCSLVASSRQEKAWGKRQRIGCFDGPKGSKLPFSRFFFERQFFNHIHQQAPACIHFHGKPAVRLATVRQAFPRLPIFQTVYCQDHILTSFQELNAIHRFGRIFASGQHLRSAVSSRGGRATKLDIRARIEQFDTQQIAPDRVLQCLANWRLDISFPPIILFGSEIIHLQDADFPLELVECLGPSFPATFIVMVAEDGEEELLEHLIALAKRKNLSQRLHFTSVPSDLPAAYLSARAIIFDRLDESIFAPAIPNAISLGRLVIASDSGDGPLWIQDRKTGFLFRSNNIEACAAAVERAFCLHDQAHQTIVREAKLLCSDEQERQFDLVRSLLDAYLTFVPKNQQGNH